MATAPTLPKCRDCDEPAEAEDSFYCHDCGLWHEDSTGPVLGFDEALFWGYVYPEAE